MTGDANENGYSLLRQVNTGNVNRLGLAWSLDLPGVTALEATPLAIGGTPHFTGTYASVYADDGATGELLGRYAITRRLRSGTVEHNSFPPDFSIAFGVFK